MVKYPTFRIVSKISESFIKITAVDLDVKGYTEFRYW